MRYRKAFFAGLIIVFTYGCGQSDENPNLEGRWEAQWKTLPESFQGIGDITSFEMDGAFIFQGDSLTVIANGFPGCVFGIDTIQHTQLWKVSNDSLHLINENNVQGISYKLESVNDNRVEMKLMEDIFLTLER